MSITDRPYAGNWAPNKRSVIQYTPDILVYINGDTSLPGCRTCHHNIDLQEFVTSVSVDCGTEAGASNASISLSIPRTYGDSMFRDGNTLLKTALEVHIYARGYFPMTGLATPGAKVGDVTLSDIPQYPYYPIFHGVVTGVGHQLSGGYHSATITCAGMLHFWQHMKISTQGSYFGSRPQNSRVRTNMTGHPYHGMTPYAIIYSLYRNTTGSAAGVGFALASQTNFGATSSTTRDSMFGMAMRYWERRFRDRLYGLRMHGASGSMFTSSQQAFLSQYRTSTAAGEFIAANLGGRGAGPDPYARDRALLLGLADRRDGRVLRQPDVNLLASANGGSHGLNVTAMQAFVFDVGAQGQVSFFESSYESKMDVATAVSNITGYEFYQDVDGDLVFKPPLYNLDTSSSRIYRIEPIDIIDISFNEAEPEATYVVIKGGASANMRGAVDEAEWGMRSVYVDYRLVAQYGWREHSIETAYYNNARSGFFAGVAQLDRLNAGANSCTVTIPMRPEMRPGYPVFIPSIDCYYYVQSLAHAFNFGSQPTTTLTLVARRRKFLPPGIPTVGAGQHGVDLVDLANTAAAPRALQVLSTEGVPRLLGFPNVVMALDPTSINPQFFVYGFQAEDSVLSTGNRGQIVQNRALFIRSFIQVLVSNGLLGLSSTVPATADPMEGPWTLPVDQNESRVIQKRSLHDALGLYIQLRDRARSALPVLQAQYERLQRTRIDLENKANRTAAENRQLTQDLPASIAQTERDILDLQSNFGTRSEVPPDLAATRRQVASTMEAVANVQLPRGHGSTRARQRTPAQIDDLAILTYLINQARPQTTGPGARDTTTDPTGTVNESATILDLLNDRKASMSINTPGYYRYYSASHPNRNQQGYAPLEAPTRAPAASGTPSPSGDPPTTSRGRRGRRSRSTGPVNPLEPVAAVRGQPRPSPREVRIVRTVLAPQAAAGLLSAAWERIRGTPPSDLQLSIMLAQWAVETGTGEGMYNFNYGGIKASGSSSYFNGATHEGDGAARVATRANFHAYGSAEEGADGYVGLLLRRYSTALDSIESAPNSDAAATAFVEEARRSGYFTGNLASYQRNVRRNAQRARDNWIVAARNAGQLETHGTPLPSQGRPDVSSEQEEEAPPEDDLQTVQVINATNVDGLTEEARRDMVSLTVGTPVNGLRVRTPLGEGTQVVPTSKIFALTFEERGVPRTSAQPTVLLRDGDTVAHARQDFQACLANPPQAEALARQFAEKVTDEFMTSVALPAQELVALAVAGITGVKNDAGNPIDSSNYAAGVPNNTATLRNLPLTTEPVRGRADAEIILLEKAQNLIIELTRANQAAMDRVLAATANQRTPTSEALEPLRHWVEGITALFQGRGVPPMLPFHTQYETQYVPRSHDTSTFSPVFPISDARGYDHYGSFQYGRGLSIEPGGNYERLMALDPFRYATPESVAAFVASVRTSSLRRDAQGNLVLNAEIRRRLADIAGDANFQRSTGGQIALQWAGNTGSGTADRTSMIAQGLANFIMSDRDAVTKIPVSNAAFNLTDLAPQGQVDTCACRGAEADLLLAAYAAGATDQTFISVDAPAADDGLDPASKWVQGQMVQAAGSWSMAQQAMRGQGNGTGRRSILDRVSGWQGIVGGLNSSLRDADQNLNRVTTTGLDRLNRQADRVETNFNRLVEDD